MNDVVALDSRLQQLADALPEALIEDLVPAAELDTPAWLAAFGSAPPGTCRTALQIAAEHGRP